jgi:hypothetical protein
MLNGFVILAMSYRKQDKPNSSKCNGDISYIKDPGTDRPNANIYKINNSSIVENAVYQISGTPGKNEREQRLLNF